MRYYHCSYSNVDAFSMLPKLYDDVDLAGALMSTPRISLSDAPERGVRGFVDAGPLEYARIKGHAWITVYVYTTDAPEKDVISYKKLRGKIFDVNVTHECWYIGKSPLEFKRVGAMGISTKLRDRIVIRYRDYGLLSEPMVSRVYGDKIKRTRVAMSTGTLARGMDADGQQTDTTASTGDWTVTVLNNDGYIPSVITETYASLGVLAVMVFDYVGLMNYEVIRLTTKETYRYVAKNNTTGESAAFVLDTLPNIRKLDNGKIVPNIVIS